jgi:hypothetical protein
MIDMNITIVPSDQQQTREDILERLRRNYMQELEKHFGEPVYTIKQVGKAANTVLDLRTNYERHRERLHEWGLVHSTTSINVRYGSGYNLYGSTSLWPGQKPKCICTRSQAEKYLSRLLEELSFGKKQRSKALGEFRRILPTISDLIGR